MPRPGMCYVKRPHKPKVPSGYSISSTTIEDGDDAVAYAGIFRGNSTQYGMPRDAINSDLRVTNLQPFARLVGDSFVSNTESQINLLADVSSLVGTGPLTNNNTVTFVQETTDDESPMWEQTYANFVSASSQYLSVATASAVQVGTSSFVPGIAFKTTTTGLQVMFQYGSRVATKPYWEISFNASNQIIYQQSDGTNSDLITDTIANRWQDGRWHIATALVDRTNLKAYLIVDGILIGSTTVTATGTLTIAGENLYIGAKKNAAGSISGFFNGQLALFKLINNAADYNIPQIWNLGVREASSSGTFTAPTSDSSKRLNNKFGTPNTNAAYFYTGLNLEDGEYEIQIAYEKGSANGILDLVIDGVTAVSQLDTYNGSTTHNNISNTYGVKITAGYHTVKILNNGKNASSTGYTVNLQWINFIKRRGHEQGGMTRALLLGDEISERNTTALTTLANQTSNYYDNEMQNAWTADGSNTEATLFVKGGLYEVEVNYTKDTANGKIDLWLGNVQILNQLDTYNGSTSRNNTQKVYARLQQGKQDIRLAVNGKNASSSNYSVYINSIRLERVSD